MKKILSSLIFCSIICISCESGFTEKRNQVIAEHQQEKKELAKLRAEAKAARQAKIESMAYPSGFDTRKYIFTAVIVLFWSVVLIYSFLAKEKRNPYY